MRLFPETLLSDALVFSCVYDKALAIGLNQKQLAPSAGWRNTQYSTIHGVVPWCREQSRVVNLHTAEPRGLAAYRLSFFWAIQKMSYPLPLCRRAAVHFLSNNLPPLLKPDLSAAPLLLIGSRIHVFLKCSGLYIQISVKMLCHPKHRSLTRNSALGQDRNGAAWLFSGDALPMQVFAVYC
jgi:hypothetical protein